MVAALRVRVTRLLSGPFNWNFSPGVTEEHRCMRHGCGGVIFYSKSDCSCGNPNSMPPCWTCENEFWEEWSCPECGWVSEEDDDDE